MFVDYLVTCLEWGIAGATYPLVPPGAAFLVACVMGLLTAYAVSVLFTYE